jgi:hypothetical protein
MRLFPCLRRRGRLRTAEVFALLILLVLLFFLYILFQSFRGAAILPILSPLRRRNALVLGDHATSGYLYHVIRVLRAVGYDVTHEYPLAWGPVTSDAWDIMWTHKYPFHNIPELKKMREHQRVNKIPGMGCITNKVEGPL